MEDKILSITKNEIELDLEKNQFLKTVVELWFECCPDLVRVHFKSVFR